MKKFFKVFGVVLLVLLFSIVLYGYSISEPLPKGSRSLEADVLANKVLNALHKKAYDETKVLEWSFMGQHDYKWFKKENKVEVSWDDTKVILYTKNPEKSKVYIDGNESVNPELVKNATDYFNNDSFWLVAPYKIFDSGTKRALVKHKGKDALLVTYASGGSTPGDSYLWILDDDYIPTSYKMWVQVIPIGGLEASWSNWITTESGCQLATVHELSGFGLKLPMQSVKAYN